MQCGMATNNQNRADLAYAPAINKSQDTTWEPGELEFEFMLLHNRRDGTTDHRMAHVGARLDEETPLSRSSHATSQVRLE